MSETVLLTVDEAAKLLKRHSSTVYRRLEGDGEWSNVEWAWKEGKDWRIEEAPLLEHLRHRPISTRGSASDPMPNLSRARFEALLAGEERKAA